MTHPFVVIVEFKLKSKDDMLSFRALIDENARVSCEVESGCLRFDVLVPRDAKDRVFLYEIYEDRAAFDVHLKSQHFENFNNQCAALIADKTIIELSLVSEGSLKISPIQ